MPDTDVVIVGAGAGGLAAAWRLTTRGLRVTLLETGRRFTPATDYPQAAPDFETRGVPYDWKLDEAGRPRFGFGPEPDLPAVAEAYHSWNRGQGRFVTGGRRRYLDHPHVRGVGGSTIHFDGEAHRYHPHALSMRSRFGVGVDWPLADTELERYYAIAEQQIGVAAPGSTAWRPRADAPTFPPHALSYASAHLVPAFEQAGLTLIPNALAILPAAYNGRPPCNYCNSCGHGCPLGDKGSADVTFLPEALRTGRLDLRTEAAATRIVVDGDGRAAAVEYRDANHAQCRVSARFIVMACGAVETPRLLLLSTAPRSPNGLANNAGQVGRNLTETLFWFSVGILPDRGDSHRGVAIDGTAWDCAVPMRHPSGWVGGFRVSTAHGAADLRGAVAYATRLVAGFGRTHQRQVRETFGRAVAILAMGDWLPNAGTYVDLDPALRDGAGRPLARITSRPGRNEELLLVSMADTVRNVLRAARADIAEETSSFDIFSATHMLGTCRMGTNPDESVADADGFAHEVPNLAFADGSLVPSSGSGDAPALTITALAIRTADRLLARV